MLFCPRERGDKFFYFFSLRGFYVKVERDFALLGRERLAPRLFPRAAAAIC